MTKKEEILTYINTNIDDTKFLRVSEEIISSDGRNGLKAGSTGYKTFAIDKEKLLVAIINGYNSDLQGHAPNDANLIQILSWTTINR